MKSSTGETHSILQTPFLDKVTQICMVTHDHRAMLDNFLKIGIGPWHMQILQPPRISNALYYGKPHSFRVLRALAFIGDFMWEVVEPLDGISIFHDVLQSRGDGLHHIGMTHHTETFDQCVAEFSDRGFEVAQSGLWDDQLRYAFLKTDIAIGGFLEIWDRPKGFSEPKPDFIYPTEPANS